jgi:ADP-ribose pyrophosphatase YjhB (NUDIX family)
MLEPFRQFNSCPRCGAPGPGADSLNPFRCARCGFVLYFNAASAVAAFIVRDDGHVLYTRRARDPGKGLLGMPGGFVDFGETAEGALRREVLEEVGLELTTLEYLASFPNQYLYADVTYNTLDLFFVATAADVGRVQALDAVASVAWLDPRSVDAGEIAFESMRRARTVLLERRSFPAA